MFKIFTVLSLVTLLAEGGSTSESSLLGPLIAFLVVVIALLVVAFWLRSRYRVVRKRANEKFRKPGLAEPVIKPEVWQKITSGELARKMIGKENS